MDFTQYRQILSYLTGSFTENAAILDMINPNYVDPSNNSVIADATYSTTANRTDDLTLCRFALSHAENAFGYLTGITHNLDATGYVVVQDFLLPNKQKMADYVNGFLRCFDNLHRQAFAQYAWDGLLLDCGLVIREHQIRSISLTLQQWVDIHQPDDHTLQQIHVLLIQAPSAVQDAMQIKYAGTPYTEFTLQEIVIVAQKEG